MIHVLDPPLLRSAGLMGDIHCEDEVLERGIEHLSALKVDALLSVGDIVDGAGDPNRTCQLLQKHAVLAVAGNHERWLFAREMAELPEATLIGELSGENLYFLGNLPKTRPFSTPRGRLLLCHGLGDNDMAALRPDDEGYALECNTELWKLTSSRLFRFVVNGHTHLPMVRRVASVTVINAGTLHRSFRQVCALADFERGFVQFYDINPTQIVAAERYSLSGKLLSVSG